MKLLVKIGDTAAKQVTAKCRKLPWVGNSFDIRESPRGPLVHVKLVDIRRLDGSEVNPSGCSKSPIVHCVEIV